MSSLSKKTSLNSNNTHTCLTPVFVLLADLNAKLEKIQKKREKATKKAWKKIAFDGDHKKENLWHV